MQADEEVIENELDDFFAFVSSVERRRIEDEDYAQHVVFDNMLEAEKSQNQCRELLKEEVRSMLAANARSAEVARQGTSYFRSFHHLYIF
jgi:hypothetical protein